MIDRDWFILRTAGRSTLPLANSLAEDGFEVWTPVRTQLIRVPRMNVRREVKLPMLPSFIFARAHHLHELLELSKRQTKAGHRDFSVFHYIDQIPMVADRHLDPLREEEAALLPKTIIRKRSGPHFRDGAKVRATGGVFQGLRGKIERCRSGKALVIFDGGSKRCEIPTLLLSEDEAFSEPRRLGEAA